MPSVGAICTAIHAVLEELVISGDVERVQNYDELTEGMNTTPTIQVYPENGEVDVGSDSTERTTFVDALTGVPGVRVADVVIRVDLYVRQRSQLNEDWGAAVDVMDALYNKLEEQGTCPPLFALDGIQAFRWTWTRVVFDYATVLYTGFRFVLSIMVY